LYQYRKCPSCQIARKTTEATTGDSSKSLVLAQQTYDNSQDWEILPDKAEDSFGKNI
jgi:hypothetical protein